jgi:putative membrane protein
MSTSKLEFKDSTYLDTAFPSSDRIYIQGQITNHQRTAQLLLYVIGSGQNAELKKFASDLLPIVYGHLRMAQTIAEAIARQASSAPK